MKRKLTILAIGLVAVAALTAVYTAGWLNGRDRTGAALVKEAQAAGGWTAGRPNALRVWNITKEKITERMTVSPDNTWAVPGTTRQPPPEPGRPDVMSDFIKAGEWGPAFNAQNRMLDEHAKKYNLEKMDWRKQKPWYKPSK